VLRSRSEHELDADRISLNVRDELTLNARTYLIGQTAYLHDRFKDIDYFLAPTGGVGYKLVDGPIVKLAVDGGLGYVGEGRTASKTQWFCMTSTERFDFALTDATTITQTLSGIWKSSDLTNSFYTAGASITTAVTTHFETKIEALDTFRSRTSPGVEKNDIALIAAFVLKF